MAYFAQVSTGWKSLDHIIDGLHKGDNVVWQVDDMDAYRKLVSYFAVHAVTNNEQVVYMRFGRHGPLLEERANLRVYTLNVAAGFESFSSEVHGIITREGKGVFYVFDSLSDLLYEWASDLMIVNFFFVTCPYLFELNTIAYFAISRNRHSNKAIARIRETTQVFIDVYTFDRKLCIHPIKIQDRYSSTMFFPHIKDRDHLLPVINSVEASRLFSHVLQEKAAPAHRILDYWDHLFIQAESLVIAEDVTAEKADKVEQLSRLVLSRNKIMLQMIRRFFSLQDLLRIKERLIGSGFIGGKALGMLLARKILQQDESEHWFQILEQHDSFYIGSDVFYSYIVQNGWWKLFMAHKTSEGYYDNAAELKKKIMQGSFPEQIRERFQLMLEYFGQSPIIARSSSLLEDAFGSAFAGKYESFFCVNQDPPEKRFEKFEEAVKRIYASMMSEDALAYRRQRGLDHLDEQMAVLVQRVSGAYHKNYFFPELGGVGLSYNPYVWKNDLDPHAGMLRIVMGMGTRAVNRVPDDYPRIVALDDPIVKPLSGLWELKKYSQHYVDVLNLQDNELQTIALSDLITMIPEIRIDALAEKDTQIQHVGKESARPNAEYWILTFDQFFSKTRFIKHMATMLKRLEQTYNNPVEIEFTVNYNRADDIQINLLQCRPFQSYGNPGDVTVPEQISVADIFFQTQGNFMGGNINVPIATIILVDPARYAALSMSDKYSVARLIGKLNRRLTDRLDQPAMLIGPGRWGTQTPAMGVPVTFSEINHMAVLVEVSYQAGDLIPDLSFGTHFFHDLTETNIFYVAVYPERDEVIFNPAWLDTVPNRLYDLYPEAKGFGSVVKVYLMDQTELMLQSDVKSQLAVCHGKQPTKGVGR